MDEKSDELKEVGKAASTNAIIDHITAAEKALDKRDYPTARRESQMAKEETESASEKIVAEVLSSTQFKINYARNIGADVSTAESLLRDAKAAFEARDYARALELARQCRDEAERAKERYKELVDLIYEAESLISKAHVVGKDTSSAERHLAKAVSMKSKNGVEAFAEASKAFLEMNKVLGRKPSEIEIPLDKAAPPSALVPGQEDEIRRMFKSLRECMLSISDAHEKGIHPKRSQRIIEDATSRIDTGRGNGFIDVEGVMDLLRQSQAALIEDIELSNPEVKSELKPKGIFSRSLRCGEWNDALLVLQNTGKTAALEVGAKLSGDVELESLPPIARLAPGEKKELKVRLRPRRIGELTTELRISFKRAYDNKPLEVEHQVKLAVK